MIDISTITELHKAINSADEIRAMIRFGLSEKWVKITKVAARELISELPMDVSPRDMEMFASHFGTLEDGVLYLG